MVRWGWAAFLLTALAGTLGSTPGVVEAEAVRRLSAEQPWARKYQAAQPIVVYCS